MSAQTGKARRGRATPPLGWAAGTVLFSAGLLLCAAAVAGPLSPQQRQQTLSDGIDHFYNLEYDSAIHDFEQLRGDDPRDPTWMNQLAASYLEKQLLAMGALDGDLFGASNQFFRSRKATPDPALETLFEQSNQAALDLCAQRLKENDKDVEGLYACGVAYAARAVHAGLVERAIIETLADARKSKEFHLRLQRADPKNYDSHLIPGIYDYFLGSLPNPVRLLVFFAGDKQRGIQMVESAAEHGESSRRDAQIMLAVMYRREKRFADARRVMETLAQAYPRNYIFALEIASLHRSAEEYAEAIRTYEAILEKVRAGMPNFQQAPAARIHFELGNLYQMTGKPENALEQLRQVPGAPGGTPAMEADAETIQEQIESQLAGKKATP